MEAFSINLISTYAIAIAIAVTKLTTTIQLFCRPPDLYHSCYTLSGVSIAQHSEVGADPEIIGDEETNELLPTHPLYNVPPKCVWEALLYFKGDTEKGDDSEETSNMDESDAGKTDDMDCSDTAL